MLLALALPVALTAQTNLAERLREDTTLQDAAIIAMRNALGARGQTVVVRRSSFAVEIGMYVETYRRTRNATTLENIQNRYAAAKGELLEPRLPATIDELVTILEMLL